MHKVAMKESLDGLVQHP